jgi:hypothetical protein
MSQTETHFGKLKRVKLNQPLVDWCKSRCAKAKVFELPFYYSTWIETIHDLYPNRYFFIEDSDGIEVWEAIEHIGGDQDDIDILIPNQDGTISFVQQFDNGGTCLSECIEDGLLKLKKTQPTQ